ncbi:hypothetical protein LCGC14_1590550 [marine sediment metagenome]|uniref:DUF4177 domain-containing protein n=1 Tax=marine sediment metagenome TaxID=412755 RepID=A0A0F9IEF3_9ZZZZ
MGNLSYAYRQLPTEARPEQIEEKLNEARSRGWELHTFTDETETACASVVFRWVGLAPQHPPFADDEEERE